MLHDQSRTHVSFLPGGRWLLIPIQLGIALLLLLAALALTPAAVARADTYTVSNTNASGPGSLRQAILDANANPGHDSITFGVSGTIVLSDTLPPLDDDVSIVGPGAESLAISGANAYRVFSIASGASVTISGVTIRDGRVTGNPARGGGIHSRGALSLNSSAYANAWSFTIGPAHATPLAVLAVSPPAGALDVALDAALVITFSEAISTETLAYTTSPNLLGWSAAWSDGGAVLTLSHAPFDCLTAYTVSVNAATSLLGNSLSDAPYVWSFSTAPQQVYLPIVLNR